jgi:drug/metabolite transporter (DMT)-like permease
VVFGWFVLAIMVLGYGTANFLQGLAATQDKADERLDPRLLIRLARKKTYLLGVAFQAFGTITAFVARRDLPLFLVQAAIGAGIAVTALLGVLVLKWQLTRAELLLMVVTAAGLAALIFSADPSTAKDPSTLTVVVLAALVVVFGAVANFAARLHGAAGSVALGALGGLSYGASAIASRPLVNASSWQDFLLDPLLYVFIAHTVAGQLIFGLALQRGATTAASAAMNAMAAPVAVVGLLLLGDQIVNGRELLAGVGFVVTVGAVIGLAFYAQPQRHEIPPHIRDRMNRLGRRRAATAEVPQSSSIAS